MNLKLERLKKKAPERAMIGLTSARGEAVAEPLANLTSPPATFLVISSGYISFKAVIYCEMVIQYCDEDSETK